MVKTIIIITIICSWVIPNAKAQSRWEAVGNGFNREVRCLYSDNMDSSLYIGGYFEKSGTEWMEHVAMWDGTKLHPMGSGLIGGGAVVSITRYKGEIFAGGYIDKSNGIILNGIARWNGNYWDTVGNGLKTPTGQGVAFKLLAHDSNLYVVGIFTKAGNIPANSIAKWNGTTWSDVGAFPNNKPPSSLNIIYTASFYKGELFIGGVIDDSTGTSVNVVSWDGSRWKNTGSGVPGIMSIVYCSVVYKNELYIGGLFTKSDGNAGNYIMKWDGTKWSEVGGGVSGLNGYAGQIFNMEVINDELYVAGALQYAGGVNAQYIAKWNGTEWCGLGSTLNNLIFAVTTYKDTLYIGGGFLKIDSDSISFLAKWTGVNFNDTCSAISGTSKIDISNSINISPNPATNKITIHIPRLQNKNITIELYDVLGRKSKSGGLNIISGYADFELHNMSPGIYFYVITDGDMAIGKGKLVVD